MRRPKSGPKSIAGLIGKITKSAFAKRGFGEGALLTEWAAIVGEHLARHTCPERVVKDRSPEAKGGTLHLRVDNGALAMEIQHLETQIIERINAYYGYKAVDRLRMVQGPLPKYREREETELPPLDTHDEQVLDAKLSNVDDGDLKAALDRLGQAVKRRRKADGK